MKDTGTISAQDWEQIEDYLSGNLDGEALRNFENRLQQEPGFREQVEEVQLLLLGVKEAALREALDGFHATPAPVRQLAPGRQKTWWAAAAILVAASIGGFFLLRKPAEERLFAHYYEPDAGLATAMGSADDYTFQRGMIDYKTGNYPQAINQWRPLLAQRPTSDTLHYFTGLAFLAQEQSDSAIIHLKQALESGKETFRSDAAWYLGLTLLKQDQKEAARTYIQQSAHPRKEALLSELK